MDSRHRRCSRALALGATDGDAVAAGVAWGVGVGRTVLARVAVGAAAAVVGTTCGRVG
jgi:hypothetical protein